MAKEVKSPNPFLDEIDDDDFLNHTSESQSGYLLNNSNPCSEYEHKKQQLLMERKRIEERTLQSTNNSLGLLHESEQVGIMTAEELVKQREQLHNIEDNLDFINSTMRISQKHINSMKSVFGGIKNYFSKNNTPEVSSTLPTTSNPRPRAASSLDNTIDQLKSDTRLSIATHPAMRNIPSYDEPDSFKSNVSAEKVLKSPIAASSQNVDEKLDENLEFMSMGLGRLKNLAIGLNDEIGLQNEMLETIHNKTDKADESVEYQNRQIKRLLKK